MTTFRPLQPRAVVTRWRPFTGFAEFATSAAWRNRGLRQDSKRPSKQKPIDWSNAVWVGNEPKYLPSTNLQSTELSDVEKIYTHYLLPGRQQAKGRSIQDSISNALGNGTGLGISGFMSDLMGRYHPLPFNAPSLTLLRGRWTFEGVDRVPAHPSDMRSPAPERHVPVNRQAIVKGDQWLANSGVQAASTWSLELLDPQGLDASTFPNRPCSLNHRTEENSWQEKAYTSGSPQFELELYRTQPSLGDILQGSPRSFANRVDWTNLLIWAT